MCLDSKYTKTEREGWLANRPDAITAYKVVRVEGEGRFKKIFPVFFGSSKSFDRKNKVPLFDPSKEITVDNGWDIFHYMAFFHLFTNEGDAIKWANSLYDQIVIKCEIPKKAITDLGVQNGATTIVTPEFTIVGEDKFLPKEKDHEQNAKDSVKITP